jgi:hypothetical protein
MHNGAAAELRAEGPSVLAACSAGAGGRTRGVLRRGPVQPGACARLNARADRCADAFFAHPCPARCYALAGLIHPAFSCHQLPCILIGYHLGDVLPYALKNNVSVIIKYPIIPPFEAQGSYIATENEPIGELLNDFFPFGIESNSLESHFVHDAFHIPRELCARW